MEDQPEADRSTGAQEAIGVVVIGDDESVAPYLRSLERLSRARVIGLLDRSKDRADAGETVHRSTDDPAIAVGWDGVDAFIHCGPLARDPDPVALVAASKKPVFFDSRGGRERTDAQTVRACIEAGEIGRVVFARFAAGNRSGVDPHIARAGGKQLAWQHQPQVLDMLGWWIGEHPNTAFAQRNHGYESVTVRYADGATAVCDISTAGPSYRELVVVGTMASMSLAWADHTSVLLPVDGSGPQYFDGSPSLDAVLDAWLRSVGNGTAPIVEASELRAAIALEEAIELSVTSGLVADVKSSRDNRSEA